MMEIEQIKSSGRPAIIQLDLNHRMLNHCALLRLGMEIFTLHVQVNVPTLRIDH
jgi:hypothetical protein